ncbi:MAG: hypothetical protein NZM43_06940 [Saprospiraceae bacterium]|nr:hypothetical protein [Saprospiraceae bacterium]MDW8484045.1 hypothetical protein [Saprospiraceae bacterium]
MLRFEQIERYLAGKMPPDERQLFEAEMAQNAELEALVNQHRLERIGLELLVEKDLRAKMQAWDRETELLRQLQPKRAARRPLYMMLRAAALIAVLVLGYWWLRERASDEPAPQSNIVQTQPKSQKRPSEKSKPRIQPDKFETPTTSGEMAQHELPSNAIEEMQPGSSAVDYAALADEFFVERDFLPPSGVKSGSRSYLEGLRSLQSGHYQDVIASFRPELSPVPTAEEMLQQELLAVAYFKNGQYAEAEMAFRRIASSGLQPYAQRAEWGIVLAILKQMPQRQSALKAALEAISAQHPFYAKAQYLRERLQTELSN